MIYRDYADEPNDYEVFPLTANKSDVEKWLMNVRCYSNDNDIPEAQYNGIIKGLDKVGMKNDQSNVVVLVGDAGNHSPDKNTLDQATSIMSKYNANFISFQVFGDKDNKWYHKFNLDAKKYLVGLSKASIKNSSIKPKLTKKPHFDNTFEIKFLSSDGKDYTNLYMFGLFTYAPDRVQMPTTVLEEGIRDALSNYLDQLNVKIQTINGLLSGRSSSQSYDPQIPKIFCENVARILKLISINVCSFYQTWEIFHLLGILI